MTITNRKGIRQSHQLLQMYNVDSNACSNYCHPKVVI